MTVRQRATATLVIALLAVCVLLGRAFTCADPMQVGADLHHTMMGASLLAGGENIYQTHPLCPDEINGTYSTGEMPLTAYLVAYPFSWFPPLVGASLWVFVTTSLLVWLLSSRGWEALLILASYPFVKAVSVAQWEPLMMCGMIAPWAAVFCICKPNTGLPVLAAFPDRRRWLAVLLGLGVSLCFMPSWPWQWLHGLPSIPGVRAIQVEAVFGYYEPTVLRPGGFLLLIALLRWRDWRGRLFLAMAIMPQYLNYNHQMAFLFIPQNRRRVLLLVLLTWLGAGMWGLGRLAEDGGQANQIGSLSCVLFYWLPSLLFVMLPPREKA